MKIIFVVNIHIFQILKSSTCVFKKNKTELFINNFLDRLALVNCVLTFIVSRNFSVRNINFFITKPPNMDIRKWISFLFVFEKWKLLDFKSCLWKAFIIFFRFFCKRIIFSCWIKSLKKISTSAGWSEFWSGFFYY